MTRQYTQPARVYTEAQKARKYAQKKAARAIARLRQAETMPTTIPTLADRYKLTHKLRRGDRKRLGLTPARVRVRRKAKALREYEMKDRARRNALAKGHAVRREAMNDWGLPLAKLIRKTSNKPVKHLRSLNENNPDDYAIILALDLETERTLFDECQEMGKTPVLEVWDHGRWPVQLRHDDGRLIGTARPIGMTTRLQRYWLPLGASYTL